MLAIHIPDNRLRISILNKEAMQKAFHDIVENYVPVYQRRGMEEEAGYSEISYKNLLLIMREFGQPKRVDVGHGKSVTQCSTVVLVCWEEAMYLATGFGVGYCGSGSHFFSIFGEKAGFGDRDDLYKQIYSLERNYTGTLWV
jgi:hypothetical protein